MNLQNNETTKELLEYVQQHPLFSVEEVLRDVDQLKSASTHKEVRKKSSQVWIYAAVAASGVFLGYLLKTLNTKRAANLIGGDAPPRFL